jgi:hypothetical protein
MNSLELCLFSATNETSRKIRGSVTDTGEEIWSVFDFINAVCEKDRNDSYGRVTYYRLVKEDSPFHQELLSKQKYMKLSGRGPQKTVAMNLNGLLYLLSILEVADPYRDVARQTIIRVLAGDRTLIEADAQALPLEQEQITGKKRKIEDEKMDHVKERLSLLLKEQRAGAFGMHTYLRLKKEVIVQSLSNTAEWVHEYVPLQNPFLIFFSALINYLEKDISANQLDIGATAPIKVKMCVDDVQQAYEAFYQPFMRSKFPLHDETGEINEEMLVPRADDTRAMMRLKELLLAQKNPLEMRVVGDPYFTKTVREMFPPNVIDVSQAKVRKYRTTLRVYTFTLLNVKNHLQGANTYHDDYDEHVCLNGPVEYELVPVSSSVYW